MKFLDKKIYIILLLLFILLFESKVFARDSKIQYTSEDISNYFLGIVSVSENYNNEAFKYLKKVQLLKDRHTKFNIEFIRTLILLEKFDQAINFSKKIWIQNELFYEVDLLLGLDSFIKKDYINAEMHFARLNRISLYNPFFEDFLGNVLIAWSKAARGNQKEDSLKFLEKVPDSYRHLTKIQNTFLECYFDTNETLSFFEKLVQDKDYNFSRYNFFSKLFII